MASSLPNDDTRTHLNTVQPQMAKARIEPNPAEPSTVVTARAEALALIDDARRRVGLSQKTFAITAQTQESQLSEAVNGRARFDVAWLFAQDEAFWQEFWPLVAETKHVSPQGRTAVRRRRLIEVIELLLSEVA